MLLLVGALLGERPLVQLAVFTVALPFLSALTVARQRFRVSARRTVTPARVPRGDTADVVLEITNADTRTGGLWMLTEQLPGDLGTSPSFVVERLAPGARTSLRYQVHGHRRGRHALGPLRLRLVDPFGLVERSAVGADSAPLIVVPRVRPLAAGGPAGGQGGGGGGRRPPNAGGGEGGGGRGGEPARRSIAVHGEDDVSTREYRHGDALRKVHWRATARTGELMVRLEERPWRAHATLLLDTRARAHLVGPHGARGVRTGPPGDDCPPPDSLEWLVEASASFGNALARRGAALRIVTDGGELVLPPGRGSLGADELLDRLAGIRPSRVSALTTGVDHLCRAAGDGPIICLLGAVGPDDVVDLLRTRSGPSTDAAVLVDIGSWVDAGLARGRRGVSATARDTLARQRDDAAALLRSAGWRVAIARADQSVADVWTALGGPALGGPALSGPGAVGVPTAAAGDV